jgi:hypothetical protein
MPLGYGLSLPKSTVPKGKFFDTVTGVLFLFSLAQSGVAQTAKVPSPKESTIADLKSQVDSLRVAVATLTKKLTDTQSDLALLWDQFNNTRKSVWELQSADSITVDPTDTSGFHALNTEAGRILVIVDRVETYLTGYRIYFKFGNLTEARLSDYTLNIGWSHKYKYKEEDLDKWNAGVRKVEIQPTVTLEPGKWNSINVMLPNTDLKDLSYLNLTMEVKGVALGPN